MPQPEFKNPEFIQHNSAEEIHARMMKNLPEDIDDMPAGFPYDFTMPAALEKDEFINFHLVRALMIAFPQYAWDEWLDLHGQQVHIIRHEPEHATGYITVTGMIGTKIAAGTIFCTAATDYGPAIEFSTREEKIIEENGTVTIAITAVEEGKNSNVAANTIHMMAKPDKNIISVTNQLPVTGGTERETNDDYYDRIAIEYENSMTFLGNDSDYIRWAKEAGAGDCIVVSNSDRAGIVKLVLVDRNGQPANDRLIQNVYNYILSPQDQKKRLLPTGCAKLECVAATTVPITYICTGLLFDDTTNFEQVKKEFREVIKTVYDEAKKDGILRYNLVRSLMTAIQGVEDFTTFLMNGDSINIPLSQEEYPKTEILDFREGEPCDRKRI